MRRIVGSTTVQRAGLWLALVTVTGCGHEAAPGESVAEVCRLENNGREVHLSGYLVPPVITLGCRESCSLYISSSRNDRDGVTVTFPVGTSNSTMDPVGFPPGHRPIQGEIQRLGPRDYRLRDDGGQVATLGDVVRVGGTLRAIERDGAVECSLRPGTIEKL